MRNNNNFLYYFVDNKQNDKFNQVNLIKITKDGNCFYRNISFFLTKNEDYHIYIRALIYEYINQNKSDIINNFPNITLNTKLINTESYIPEILKDGTFAGDLEISQAIKIFNLKIAVYTLYVNKDVKYYKFYYYYNENKTEFKKALMILLYSQMGSHYSHLLYNENYIRHIFYK